MIKKDCRNLWRRYDGYLSCSVESDNMGSWSQDCKVCKNYYPKKQKVECNER